jgi:hypothetical protein
MPSQEDINAQMQLLAAHRRTLTHLLNQYATHSGAYVPPAIVSGISEARAGIQQSKRALRTWNVQIDDLPDDGDTSTGEPTAMEFGQLLLAIVRSGNTWQLVVENPGEQEVLSIALTLRPPASVFVGQTQFTIARVVAGGRAATKPFTLVDSTAAPRPRPVSSAPPMSHARRTRLEEQRDRLDTRIAKIEADIDYLENQRRLAAGREQLQRKKEIEELQDTQRRDEQELQTIEAQLADMPAIAPSANPQLAEQGFDQHPVPMRLHLLVSYSVASQGIHRAEGDLLVALA